MTTPGCAGGLTGGHWQLRPDDVQIMLGEAGVEPAPPSLRASVLSAVERDLAHTRREESASAGATALLGVGVESAPPALKLDIMRAVRADLAEQLLNQLAEPSTGGVRPQPGGGEQPGSAVDASPAVPEVAGEVRPSPAGATTQSLVRRFWVWLRFVLHVDVLRVSITAAAALAVVIGLVIGGPGRIGGRDASGILRGDGDKNIAATIVTAANASRSTLLTMAPVAATRPEAGDSQLTLGVVRVGVATLARPPGSTSSTVSVPPALPLQASPPPPPASYQGSLPPLRVASPVRASSPIASLARQLLVRGGTLRITIARSTPLKRRAATSQRERRTVTVRRVVAKRVRAFLDANFPPGSTSGDLARALVNLNRGDYLRVTIWGRRGSRTRYLVKVTATS